MKSFFARLTKDGFKELKYCEWNGLDLGRLLEKDQVAAVDLYEVNDTLLESRLRSSLKGIKMTVHGSPNFITTPAEHEAYTASTKNPHLQTAFYAHFRKARNILMTKTGGYVGGRLTFDSENRKPMPKGLALPEAFPSGKADTTFWKEAKEYVEGRFGDSASGDLAAVDAIIAGRLDFFPIDHDGSMAHLTRFIDERLSQFGPFQDAFLPNPIGNKANVEELRNGTLFHSVLSPMINCGLLDPMTAIQMAVEAYHAGRAPIQSVEGFVRQILGWREFMRYMYLGGGKALSSSNQLGNHKGLDGRWYAGTLGIPPVDDAIRFAFRYGYLHHILRLMVVANLMGLARLHPSAVYAWFMEFSLDAYDWVMAGNVYGMATYASPMLSTKPYISGSNYVLRMSHYPKGPWCATWDGLLYRYLDANAELFLRNGRMLFMMGNLRRKSAEQREMLFGTADAFLSQLPEYRERVSPSRGH
jgi:deoxyribodipyrimidine photolyase-related protein